MDIEEVDRRWSVVDFGVSAAWTLGGNGRVGLVRWGSFIGPRGEAKVVPVEGERGN